MSDKTKDKLDMGTAPASTDIDDIGQVGNAVAGHLRASTEVQQRTDNVIRNFLGAAINAAEEESADSVGERKKSDFAEDHPSAPPEAVGLAEYVGREKKKLLKAGYTQLQASLIVMADLGKLLAYTGIANNEKVIGVVRRVMTYEVKKGAQEVELAAGKPTTAVGRVSASHRDRAKFAMRGHGHRNRT